MLHIFVKFYVLDIEWRNRGFVPQCLDWFVSLNNVCDFLFWWAALPKESVNIVKPLQSEGSGTPSVIRRDVGIQGILGMLTCVVPKWCHLSLTSSTSYQIIPPLQLISWYSHAWLDIDTHYMLCQEFEHAVDLYYVNL